MAYKMLAVRNNDTFKSEKGSVYTALANARIWASEGWRVTITDAEGKQFAPDELAKRVSEMQRLPVKVVAETEPASIAAAETQATETAAMESEAAEAADAETAVAESAAA